MVHKKAPSFIKCSDSNGNPVLIKGLYLSFKLMEPYLQISKINDFIFCPRSIYLHNIYEGFKTGLYHSSFQTVGKIKHENVDKRQYSSASRYLQGLEIYSNRYNLAGKLDVFDRQQGILIERKYQIKQIFDGYRYQLYAQYFCLKEMGFKVKRLCLHSLKDNKRYYFEIPDRAATKEFSRILKEINNYCLTGNLDENQAHQKSIKKLSDNQRGKKQTKNKQKCAQCIYRELCF